MNWETVKRSAQGVAVWEIRMALLTVLALTASLGFGQSAFQMDERSSLHGKMAPAWERTAR